MFEVRTWLDHYGFATADWRKQADDHLVTQLMFLSNLLREGSVETLGDAAHFLDQHLLRWSKDFFAGVATRAGTSFYAGLAILSEAWLQTLRDALHRATGVTRASLESVAEKRADQDHVAPFMPGAAPSW
jgi:TorA maturation chaperone TorD